MLGKLIKYDMKALNRFLIILHGFLLLMSVLGRIFITERIELTSTQSIDQNSMTLALAFIVFFLAVMGVSFGTYIVIAVRFYKNLYSDEGYLSWALPVTGGQHLLSKTIAGSIWAFIDVVLLFLSMYIVAATPSVTAAFLDNKDTAFKELGISGEYSISTIIVLFLAGTFMGILNSVLTTYLSIVMGQFFSGHRILGAVVCYFALSALASIVTAMPLAASGLFLSYSSAISAESGSFSFAKYMTSGLCLSFIVMAVLSAVYYIITYCLMKKTTNLT